MCGEGRDRPNSIALMIAELLSISFACMEMSGRRWLREHTQQAPWPEGEAVPSALSDGLALMRTPNLFLLRLALSLSVTVPSSPLSF